MTVTLLDERGDLEGLLDALGDGDCEEEVELEGEAEEDWEPTLGMLASRNNQVRSIKLNIFCRLIV